MKRGFKIDKKKHVSKEAVCSYFGERGMQVAPAELAFHAFGTYTDGQLKTMPAIAVIIKESPEGYCELSDTADGLMDIYSLTDIYGECQDEVPAPLYAIAAAKRSSRPAKR